MAKDLELNRSREVKLSALFFYNILGRIEEGRNLDFEFTSLNFLSQKLEAKESCTKKGVSLAAVSLTLIPSLQRLYLPNIAGL
jgi:hypothetical protein